MSKLPACLANGIDEVNGVRFFEHPSISENYIYFRDGRYNKRCANCHNGHFSTLRINWNGYNYYFCHICALNSYKCSNSDERLEFVKCLSRLEPDKPGKI